MNSRMYPTWHLALLVVGALAIIFAIAFVRGLRDAENEQRKLDGLQPRPGFLTRLFRWARRACAH